MFFTDPILDFALALEIFENELYKAILGTSAVAAQNDHFAGVRGQLLAAAPVAASLRQIQKHEAAHVTLLQQLGATNGLALTAASFDFTGNRSTAGGGPYAAAGASTAALYALLQTVEDAGVRAYEGQLVGLVASSALETLLRIQSVEARHVSRVGRLAGANGVGTTLDAFEEPLDRAAAIAIFQPFFIPTIQ